MRKLASIQRIWKIEPIEGADRIELAHVLGWQCVVNKGQFQPMDIAVYFEIDSFLPIRDEFEFMRSSSYKKTDIMGEGFRLRTMRFRGQISQGLLLPISQFPEIPKDADVGDDVTNCSVCENGRSRKGPRPVAPSSVRCLTTFLIRMRPAFRRNLS